MLEYLDLLRDILDKGKLKDQRAVLSDNSKPKCYSVFGRQLRFHLQDGFPIVTTRKISFNIVKAELLWFLRGVDNVRWLQEQGCKIWDAWADENGWLGLCYPSLWRRYPGPNGPTDQIAELVNNLEALKDDSSATCGRRLVLLSWHPELTWAKTPAGCHTMAQFDLTYGRLSCHLTQRSADCFLGLPYNFASYALLTHLLAKVCGLKVGELVWSGVDCHVYENHLLAVEEQLRRGPLPLPRLFLDKEITSLDDLRLDQIRLAGYSHHLPLSAEVAV